MRSRYIWAIGVGLLVGLGAGCKENPKSVAVAPDKPAADTPKPYPADTTASTFTPTPPPAPAGDAYTPVDTTPIPPEPGTTHKSSGTRTAQSTASPHPHNSYASASSKGGKSYTVKKGDTLQEISQKMYGTTKKWRRIYEANRGTIKGGPEKIMPGMKLTIPK